MKLELRELRTQDHKKAIQFAIKGMHFDWYMDSKFLLNLYGRYFWYLEITRATQVLAAYYGEEFAGVLLYEGRGEDKKYRSFGKTVYVKILDFLQNTFVKDGVGVYEEANRDMFRNYSKSVSPDGEIVFLAANPDIKVKGIGSLLLGELEKREKGKKVYLFTDDACTYQFYEHRGFERAGQKNIDLKIGEKKVSLQCFLYSKTIA